MRTALGTGTDVTMPTFPDGRIDSTDRASINRNRAEQTGMGNTFGRAFRVTTWGESHGDAVGVTVDGCPPGLPLSVEAIQAELNRRRPGQSDISTQRREADEAIVLSGVFEGVTLGTPISIGVWNGDARGKDYDYMRHLYRPSHADYTYQAKYGIRNWKGGRPGLSQRDRRPRGRRSHRQALPSFRVRGGDRGVRQEGAESEGGRGP